MVQGIFQEYLLRIIVKAFFYIYVKLFLPFFFWLACLLLLFVCLNVHLFLASAFIFIHSQSASLTVFYVLADSVMVAWNNGP